MATSSKREVSNSNAFNFVEELPELFKCGVCRLVLRDPHITECCGKNACHSCITKVAEDGGACPIPGCGCQNVKINFNRGLRSDILESHVYCQSKETGCEWVGKLDELSEHLKKECLFVEEECQYHCGKRIQHQAIENHEKVCEKFPTKCHQCGEMCERYHHADHVKVCPFTKVECPFHIVGCKSKVANKDLQQHFNDSLSEHHSMVFRQSQSIQTQLREAILTTQDQKQKLEVNKAKIDLLNTEVVEVKGMASDFQHSLEEAEREYIELQRLHDQCKGQIESHVQHRTTMSRMFEKNLAALTFESKVRCYGPTLPSIDPADIVSRPEHSCPTTEEYTPALSFTIQNFVEERKNDAVLCMPPFYSHKGGYKMCLVVHCKGFRETKGNYLIVAVSGLQGKYDDHLQWPLNCTVAIEIKKAVYGPVSVSSTIEVKSQNRVYEDNFRDNMCVAKTVNLGLLGSCNNGSLTVNVNNVIIK